MQLTRLNIERVRNLQAVALQELQPFNIFYGQNGSGKTSILEAIHLLATGRSFRTHIPHRLQRQSPWRIALRRRHSRQHGQPAHNNPPQK